MPSPLIAEHVIFESPDFIVAAGGDQDPSTWTYEVVAKGGPNPVWVYLYGESAKRLMQASMAWETEPPAEADVDELLGQLTACNTQLLVAH